MKVCPYPGCSKSFKSTGHLNRHHKIHFKKPIYQCYHPTCKEAFPRHHLMMQHYQTHSASSP
ncbi:hypothetical protein CONCODRAFT_44402 [Conidiobolus coronatus NRRL 28638]|uniref:C2H2-type domain-containing protein n=1 Tax=Conidiobolus coronatus (strain ATCC 28846 / CBS 209.66 / NRRL 28638) TaxID=796925 RepID=A0A137NS52_CONC2|nr:hypothetical protein CONCODRAFT_44402 [Conidiobolus coronatus NRRL 28638]|eukprot:KXN65585.1 hypothetical protein CONCODRAFT_44402 [Conidiobolus coronatus NRRL 28638]